MPVSTFADPVQCKAFLGAVLPLVEKRKRRRISPDLGTRLFLHYVREGWAWCEAHRLPLQALTIRVDSGKVGKMSGASKLTSFQLIGGFGVQVLLDTAKRQSGGSRKTQLTVFSAKISKHHMIRSNPESSGWISQGRVDLTGRVAPFGTAQP
jgi:hypothetical protein